MVLGGFKSASIERNRQLHMFQTKPAGPAAKGGVKRNGRGGGGGGMGRRNTVAEKKKRELMVSDRDWGNWEKYSSGFAGRMMKKVTINFIIIIIIIIIGRWVMFLVKVWVREEKGL